MQGKYVNGRNKAHRNNVKRETLFNCSVYGTFNIKVTEAPDFSEYTSTFSIANTDYYLVKITKNKTFYYGYLVNWKLSVQLPNLLEIVSKQLLPDTLKEGELELEILNKWSNEVRDIWAKDMYSWQTFDWTPNRRANSDELSNNINKAVVEWKDKTVLDIGSNYGYHSFNASKKGATVTGIEINDSALAKSEVINDHIEMQDVKFFKREKDTKQFYDVILYLSVHHQIDKNYSKLKETLDDYKSRCNILVTELIMPPMFGKSMNVNKIDDIVDGEVLMNYKHPVRGIRRLYIWRKDV